MSMKKTIVGLFAVLLGSCSSGVSSDPGKGGSNVAILSFVGGQFHALENVAPSSGALWQRWQFLEAQRPIQDYGYDWGDLFDASETRRWQHDVADWSIDSFVVSIVTQALGSTYKITPFEQKPTDLGFEGFYAFEGEKFAGKIADAIRAQPGFALAKNIDAYVVVLPGAWLLMGRERHSYGLGIFKTFMKYGDDVSYEEGSFMLHAFYYVMVLDGSSLEMIAGAPARDDDDRRWRLKGHPGKFVDPSYWAASYDALTPAQSQKLVEGLEVLVKESLPDTLRKIKLIP
jgi:hypothetical protein